MVDILVRQAALDDTQAISLLFRARIRTWQRMDAQGHVQDVPYEALTIYERWLHGGAWMSVETAAIQLSRLLSGAGIPLVAEVDGQVVAYAEAYHSTEPSPFGDHVNLASLIVHPIRQSLALDEALVSELMARAKALKAKYVTVSRAADSAEPTPFGTAHTPKTLARLRRMSMPARLGQIFYQANEHLNADAAQISGWHMPVGRVGSARQQWETLWHRTWDTLPEIRAQKTHRLRVTAAGQEAFVCCKQQMYDPRSADIYCWSPKVLSSQLLSAVRDWSHRQGYRTLVMIVTEDTIKTLGSEAEADGYVQEVAAITP